MFRRPKQQSDVNPEEARPPAPSELKDALRQARIENADRTGVVVDLRDAEVARLDLLNDALDPIFLQIPDEIDLFDRGLSRGDVPRLWLDSVAHVHMGREKRVYRFVQDTRYGRKVLAETLDSAEIVSAVTQYIARRLIDRDRSLAEGVHALPAETPHGVAKSDRRRGMRAMKAFLFGLVVGVLALFATAWLLSPPH
jgi:hypothetical protein